MTVTFVGTQIDGTHGLCESSPQPHVLRRYYWGLLGETEKRGSEGRRQLLLDMRLHDNYSFIQCDEALKALDNAVTDHGKLIVTTSEGTRTYNECTLDEVQRVMPTQLPDVAGSIAGNVGEYFIDIILVFSQLLIET